MEKPMQQWIRVCVMPLAVIIIAGVSAVPGVTRAQQAGGGSPAPVIDMHMHAPRAADAAAWQSEMDALNVRLAMFIGIPSQLEQPRQQADRFLGALMFPCERGGATSSGARCFDDGSEFPPLPLLTDLMARGVVRGFGEVNAQYMNVAPNDPRLEPYYALAESADLPFGIHLGIGAPGIAYPGPGFPPVKSPHYSAAAGNPLLLEPVLVKHPKLRLYVMHAGWPFLSEMTYMMYMHPQLYADVSVLQWAIPRPAYYSYLKSLVDAGFAGRLMFGSDGGVRHLRMGIDAIEAADFLTAQQKRDILYNNAAKFLRLEAKPPSVK